jgi:aspartyl-tRNA synthetase
MFDPTEDKAGFDLAEAVRREWVHRRPRPRHPRGEANVEPEARHRRDRSARRRGDGLQQARRRRPSRSRTNIDTGEEKRLQYRYLDLAPRPAAARLRARHLMNQATRNYFCREGFLELETPFMVKYTPGGARNFLVPARLNPGSSTRSRRARSSSSSSSWSRASTATSRS